MARLNSVLSLRHALGRKVNWKHKMGKHRAYEQSLHDHWAVSKSGKVLGKAECCWASVPCKLTRHDAKASLRRHSSPDSDTSETHLQDDTGRSQTRSHRWRGLTALPQCLPRSRRPCVELALTELDIQRIYVLSNCALRAGLTQTERWGVRG